ncbi:MAG: hypothetical protein CL693_07210 [Cellvibrionaceae bacterium]|nr:hypothetical protein [Cellvibrionaceae bacterium]|tara:strand:+ start:16222 stop:16848 length:627 start_codon:yes stop_codon:yes gene_type:complete
MSIMVVSLESGKPIPTQARARLKRDALIEAAIVDFQTLGYDHTTAKSVAKRAEVATGTFYQYFHNKDDMLRTIAQQRFAFLFDHVEAPSAGEDESVTTRFQRILTLIYDFHQQDRELHQVLEQRRHLDPQLESILGEGEAVLEARVLRFVSSFNLDNPTAVAFNLFAMAEGLVHRHVFSAATENTPKRQDVIELGAEMLASYLNHYRT